MAQQNKGKGRSRRSGSGSTKGQNTLQHPGAVLAQILEDTPTALAAKWFSLSEAELLAVLEGRAPMTAAMAQQAGAVFGTGSAPFRCCASSAHAAPLIYFNCSAFKAKGRITVSASGCRQPVFPLAFRPFRSLPGRSGSTEFFSGVSAVHQDPSVKVQDAQLLLCQSHPPRFRPQRRT